MAGSTFACLGASILTIDRVYMRPCTVIWLAVMGASFEGSDDDQTLDAKKRRRVDSGKR